MQESRGGEKEASLWNVDMFSRVQCPTQCVGFIILFIHMIMDIHMSVDCGVYYCKVQFVDAGGNMYENEKMADLIIKILNMKYFAEHKTHTYFERIA